MIFQVYLSLLFVYLLKLKQSHLLRIEIKTIWILKRLFCEMILLGASAICTLASSTGWLNQRYSRRSRERDDWFVLFWSNLFDVDDDDGVDNDNYSNGIDDLDAVPFTFYLKNNLEQKIV